MDIPTTVGSGSRESTNKLRELMNDRLLATCVSARALGIKIYTIGLSVPSNSTTKMLADCSDGEGYYFLPDRPSQLDKIFEEIAAKLSVLRISR